jgi:hypothetical protein
MPGTAAHRDFHRVSLLRLVTMMRSAGEKR